jgi:hypothetical protein
VKKEGLKPLHARAKELIAKICIIEVLYILQTMNREADALANKAIDEKISSLEPRENKHEKKGRFKRRELVFLPTPRFSIVIHDVLS